MQEQIESPDALSATIRRLRVPSWNVREARLTLPWGIDVPSGRVCFYILRSGNCQLILSDGSNSLTLQVGDFVVLPHGQPHRLCDRSDNPVATHDDLLLDTQTEREATSIVLGYFSLDTVGRHPLLECLPDVIQVNRKLDQSLRDVEPLLRIATDEQTSEKPGSSTIAGHLTHVVFLKTLTTYIVGEQNDGAIDATRDASWLRASMDPMIGPVITMMQSELQKPWTVESLARHAKMSRTTFSERFRNVVGQPPLQYLTEYRMQRAGELLQETEFGIKRIAALVGYKSATSFSIAFKRYSQQTPLGFRRNGNARS